MARRAFLATVSSIALAAIALTACTSNANGGEDRSTTSRAPATTSPATPSAATTTVRAPSTAEATADIATWANSRAGSADVSIGDLTTGTVTDVTPGPQATVRIAAIMKVSIAISILRLRNDQKRALTPTEIVELGRMIEISDTRDADALWSATGGTAGVRAAFANAGLTHTAFQPGKGWGFTLTTAHDQAQLATALAMGRLLVPADTGILLALMRQVHPNQNWGFADTVGPSLQPAIKNGWYEDSDAPFWRVHCMAIFDGPRLAHPFSIVVMTRYPAELGIAYGQETCRGVGKRLGAWLAAK